MFGQGGVTMVRGRSTKDILLRPALYTAVVCLGTFGVAAIVQHEKHKNPRPLCFDVEFDIARAKSEGEEYNQS